MTGHRLEVAGGVAARRAASRVEAHVLGGEPLDRNEVAVPGCYQRGGQVAEERVAVGRVVHQLGKGAGREVDVAGRG